MKSSTPRNKALHFLFACNHQFILFWYVLVSLMFGSANGQDCACAPASYKFTFDFGLTCPPVNITQNGGVETSYCQISEFGGPNDNITDTVPAEVYHVDVLELSSDSSVLRQANYSGSYFGGDSFTFDSIIQQGNIEAPKIIQLNIYATNILDQPIINIFAVSFTNDCNFYPVLDEGNSAGWVHFTELGVPPRSSCPVVPTEMPTGFPTAPPSLQPATPSPTGSPSTSPFSISPVFLTENPTSAPTKSPTKMPTRSPILSPTPPPSVTPETPPPTGSPGTPSPSVSPVTPPTTEQPVAPPPTEKPVTPPPTKAPVTPPPSSSEAPFPTVLSMSYDLAATYDIDLGSDIIEEFGKDFVIPKQKIPKRKNKEPENSGTIRRLRVPSVN